MKRTAGWPERDAESRRHSVTARALREVHDLQDHLVIVGLVLQEEGAETSGEDTYVVGHRSAGR